MKVKDRSPIHRGWASESTLREINNKERENDLLSHKRDGSLKKQKVEKILDVRFPEWCKKLENREIFELLFDIGMEKREK